MLVANATNRAFYFGGGGESKEKTSTIFDNSFYNFSLIEKRGWEVKYLFDGSHSDSQKLLQGVGAKGKPFSNKATIDTLNEIEATLDNPNSKTEQVMIFLDTHGDFKDGKYLVSTDEGDIDILPQLNRIKANAAKRKVKLGIVGGTCFSGNLLSLANENTCVITASPPDTIGFKSVTDQFSSLIAKGVRNLEELHLQSRVSINFMGGQPLISTSAGMQAYDLLKPLRRQLVGSLMEIELDKNKCVTNNFQEVIQNISNIRNAVNSDFLRVHLNFQTSKLEKIASKVIEYEKQYGAPFNSSLRLDCVNVSVQNLPVTGCFRSPAELKNIRNNLSFERLKLFELSQDPNNDVKDRSRINLRLSKISILLDGIESIQQTEQFKKKERDYNQLPKDISQKLDIFSHEIGRIERDLYSYLYKYFQSKEKKQNACSTFTL